MAYADRLETLLALVRAALGREPRQGRQGHDADRRARPGRPALAVAAFHRRPARQAVHRDHDRTSPARGRASIAELAKRAGEPDFGGKTIGDLVAAQGRATAETLAKNGCPVRTIHIDTLDETSLGELLMHFMLETIIAAHLLGVDAFDQPAVEEGKVLAKQYLAAAG